MKYKFSYFAGLLLLVFSLSEAQAACTGSISSPTAQPDTAYDPFTGLMDVTTYTVTVTNTSGTDSCDFALSLHRDPTDNPEFTPGLNYNLGGGISFFTTAQTPTLGASVLQTATLAPLASEQLSFTTETVTGQVVAKASYQDGFFLRLYEVSGGAIIGPQLASKIAAAIADVASGCSLPAPDVSTLDFSANIVNGHSNEIAQTVTFNNIACTEAAKIKLTGNVMLPTTAITAIGGFDNFINYQAVATFDSAVATLVTNESAAEESVTTTTTSNGFTTTGTMSVDIKMLDSGQPILPGTYSNILTVIVDPNP